MPKKISQNVRVLRHLKCATLTSRNAIWLYSITRLAARINDLREDGYNIKTAMVVSGTDGTRYAVYSLGRPHLIGINLPKYK